MKAKKTKSFRKNVQFYRMNFNFIQPYQLLLDGNFIKQMIDHDIDLEKQFLKFTKQKCWKHTTQCVQRELKQLQSLFPRAYKYAQKLSTIDCRHIEGVSPSDCFKEITAHPPGEINNYYWVCTQDDELRSELHKVPYVPVMHLYQNNLLELAEPSRKTKIQVKDVDKYKPNEDEMKIIQPINKLIRKETQEKRMLKERKLISQLALKMKKPALGPNPLSKKRKRFNEKIKKRRHRIKNKKTRQITASSLNGGQ